MLLSNHPWRILVSAVIFPMALSAGLTAQVRSSDWPQFRGSGGQGISADKGVPLTWSQKENIVWKIETPGSGTSSPIIVGDKIYITCYSGFNVPGMRGNMDDLSLSLVCLNRADGKVVWNTKVPPRLPEQATMREGHGYASSTPVADAERIYCFFGKTGVVAFSYEGKQLWKKEVGSQLHGFGSGTSPVLVDDLLVVNASVEDSSLVALDKKSGDEVWRTPGIKESWNTPIVVSTESGKKELVVAMMGKVLGIDLKSGKQLWSCATDIPWYMVPSLVAHEGVVYAIGGRGTGGALAVKAGGSGDVTKTHRLWTGQKGSNVPSPILHEGHLYWIHENTGVAYCAELKTGKIIYEERTDATGGAYASPVMVDGKIYYVSRMGRTIVVPAKPTFQKLAQNDLADRSQYNSSPAVADGRLYLRSDKHLYCIGTK